MLSTSQKKSLCFLHRYKIGACSIGCVLHARSTPRKRRKALQQQEEYQVVECIPTVEEYLALREAVGWERLDEQITARALANALFTVCILHNGKVIGCGRIIGDGGLYFYIQNIIVL